MIHDVFSFCVHFLFMFGIFQGDRPIWFLAIDVDSFFLVQSDIRKTFLK